MEEKNLHVRIVPMTADHLDEVAELERICFSTPWSRNMLAEELDNYLSAFLVALDDNDKVAGYAGLQAVLDEGYITNVAVRPDCRKQGVAGKLLQVFLDFAQANRLAFLTLEVRASNYPAIALYGSRGFRGVGRRKNYYEHPREDAIIMTREFERGPRLYEKQSERPVGRPSHSGVPRGYGAGRRRITGGRTIEEAKLPEDRL